MHAIAGQIHICSVLSMGFDKKKSTFSEKCPFLAIFAIFFWILTIFVDFWFQVEILPTNSDPEQSLCLLCSTKAYKLYILLCFIYLWYSFIKRSSYSPYARHSNGEGRWSWSGPGVRSTRVSQGPDPPGGSGPDLTQS